MESINSNSAENDVIDKPRESVLRPSSKFFCI